MTVHAAPSYGIYPQGEPPDGYPDREQPDDFRTGLSFATFEERRAEFIKHVLNNPSPHNTKPAWYELVRIAGGGKPHEGILFSALDFIEARKDCADFVLHAILRMLYSFTEEAGLPEGRMRYQGELSPELIRRAKNTILNFKYFPDEPGVDSMCTWTENHYILFSSAAFLAGQLYPDAIFSNSGETGKQKMERNRTRILRWLYLRFRTGFSEWLSHVYYDEDLAALLSLVDFAQDEEISRKSAMLVDLTLLDMALNSLQGVFGSTHGRSYENTKKWASNEGTTDTMKLMFGQGIFSGFDNMSAAAFALSGYRPPPVIEEVVRESASCDEFENYQRMGIRLDEMERWGLHPDNFEDGMLLLTLEAYLHPRTISNTLKMFDRCNWWQNDFFKDISAYRGLLRALGALGTLPLLARLLERDICRNTREEVNAYTYRTPDYMLSTAQDYRKGNGGDQQQIWQATLGPDAVCFTTHPAKIEGLTPNYWTGSGLLPRAAQVRNLVIAIYNIKKIPALYVPVRHFFTHAWLPRDKFDEVVEREGWIFARLGQGYLALRSRNGYVWREKALEGPHAPREKAVIKEGFASISEKTLRDIVKRCQAEDVHREVIADGAQNIWICQMGREAEDGDFSLFIQSICQAKLEFEGLNVRYQAPGLGEVRFGWEGLLLLDGVELPLHDYPRYRNLYVQAEFNSQHIRVRAGSEELILNWETGERSF